MENKMVMGRNLIVTTNFANFKNIPRIGGSSGQGYCLTLYKPQLPKNIVLGKTYFTIMNGDLVAFRIKAYCFTQNVCDTYLWCFVETASGFADWTNNIFKNHIFASVEDYYNYLASGVGNIKIEYVNFSNLGENNGFELRNTYYWNKANQRPQKTRSRMFYVLVDEENVYVGLDYVHAQYGKAEQGYSSGEDCIKANIDGMNIIEFAEPKVSFSFTIEEPKEPKVRVLKFID